MKTILVISFIFSLNLFADVNMSSVKTEEKKIMEHQQEYTKRIIALREKIKADNLKKRTSVNRNILEYNQYNKKLNN